MLPQRSAEIKIEWLGGGGPWVSCKMSQRSAGVYTDRLHREHQSSRALFDYEFNVTQ
jgi:hypothetical protein